MTRELSTGQSSARRAEPGERGYLRSLRRSLQAGLITRREWAELLVRHGRVLHGGEFGLTVDRILRVEANPLELRLLMLEVGDKLPPPLCRYPSHRFSDWLDLSGRTNCGVCHPPPTREAVAAYITFGRLDGRPLPD